MLRILAHINNEQRRKHPSQPNVTYIPFVKERQSAKTTPRNVGVLAKAQSWKMRVDLEMTLQFQDVVQTILLSGIVVWSTVNTK